MSQPMNTRKIFGYHISGGDQQMLPDYIRVISKETED
jgi:hypothetical protein